MRTYLFWFLIVGSVASFFPVGRTPDALAPPIEGVPGAPPEVPPKAEGRPTDKPKAAAVEPVKCHEDTRKEPKK